MTMPLICLSAVDDSTNCLHIPAEEWKALMTVARFNGWDVIACKTLPGDSLRRRNADFRIPWSGGRTMGDGDRMSHAEARSLADAIEAGARDLVEFLREADREVTLELSDFEEENRRSRPLIAEG